MSCSRGTECLTIWFRDYNAVCFTPVSRRPNGRRKGLCYTCVREQCCSGVSFFFLFRLSDTWRRAVCNQRKLVEKLQDFYLFIFFFRPRLSLTVFTGIVSEETLIHAIGTYDKIVRENIWKFKTKLRTSVTNLLMNSLLLWPYDVV